MQFLAVLSRQKSIFYIDTSYTGSLTGGLWKSLLAFVCYVVDGMCFGKYKLRFLHLSF